MNYEQKYKEALGWMQSLYGGLHGVTKEDAEHYFPELKESEDERIRKTLIENFKWFCGDYPETTKWGKDDNLLVKDIIAWLEKQGKQTRVELGQSGMTKTSDKELEPKFHPGDWVIDNFGNTYQIETATEIESEHIFGYTIVGGGYFNDNSDVRLWTIADAKDGDILVDKYNNVGIYKEIGAIYWDSYIYLGCDGVIRGFSIGGRHEQTGTHPATKEQRDTLFAKMKEAGYKWDTEKKELKKIETTAWSEEDEKIALSIEQVMNCASLLNIVPDEIERVRTWLKILKQRI